MSYEDTIYLKKRAEAIAYFNGLKGTINDLSNASTVTVKIKVTEADTQINPELYNADSVGKTKRLEIYKTYEDMIAGINIISLVRFEYPTPDREIIIE